MPTDQKLRTLTPAQFAFLDWMNRRHPKLLKAAEERRDSIDGFFDSVSNVFKQVMEKAPDLAQQYVKGEQELAQLRANIARAQNNQYPIQYASVAPTAPQMPTVPPLVWGALGAVAVWLIFSKR